VTEADPSRDTLVWDTEVPGLILRLRSGGARFAFHYKQYGRTRRTPPPNPMYSDLGPPQRSRHAHS